MNQVNRVVAILFFLLLLVFFVGLGLFPTDMVNWLQVQLSTLTNHIARFQAFDPTNFNLARIAVVVAALLVFLPLLMAEFSRRSEALVRLQTSTGAAQVTTDSVGRRLAWHLDQLADVITVTPAVRSRGELVDVVLDVETSPEIDVPMKTEEVMLVTREIVEDRMGLKMGKLDVRIRHSDYPEVF
ncbi:MAG: hypothetical protein GXP37_02310 [Chloroflexi bacterium]|nr:hypothetical protein [Chloroflexota bacterium]